MAHIEHPLCLDGGTVTLVRTQGALLRDLGDGYGGDDETEDARSYPGSGHHGGVKSYSCIFGIAPMEVDMESYKFRGSGNGQSLAMVP